MPQTDAIIDRPLVHAGRSVLSAPFPFLPDVCPSVTAVRRNAVGSEVHTVHKSLHGQDVDFLNSEPAGT